MRAKVKIEGEKRHRRSSSSGSDDSSSSESSLPSFTATTRLTLSERFGKMAQWSLDRSNMENMRITKDSSGGALKVMIEEGTEEPAPRRYKLVFFRNFFCLFLLRSFFVLQLLSCSSWSFP